MVSNSNERSSRFIISFMIRYGIIKKCIKIYDTINLNRKSTFKYFSTRLIQILIQKYNFLDT